jgi:hypothetical protein
VFEDLANIWISCGCLFLLAIVVGALQTVNRAPRVEGQTRIGVRQSPGSRLDLHLGKMFGLLGLGLLFCDHIRLAEFPQLTDLVWDRGRSGIVRVGHEGGISEPALERRRAYVAVAKGSGGCRQRWRRGWPEPHTAPLPDGTSAGARVKDTFENYLRRAVCKGSMTLATAQEAIAADWVGAWMAAGRR